MTNLYQKNLYIIIASHIPGLGLVLLGKRKLGFGIMLAVGLLFLLFWINPHMVTWFMFGIPYLAQMAYAAGFVPYHTTEVKEITANPNKAQGLFDRFSNKKRGAEEVLKSLSTILESDEQLLVALVGRKENSSRLMFAGVTHEHLILSKCNRFGNPSDPERIPKDSVSWVNIKVAESGALISFEIEGGEKTTLHLPKTLRQQAKSFLDEFPGAWTTDYSLDAFSTLPNENNGSKINLVTIIEIVLVTIIVIVTNKNQPLQNYIFWNIIFFLFLYIQGWFEFVNIVSRYMREPGLTQMKVLSVLPKIALWLFSLYLLGVIVITIVKYL